MKNKRICKQCKSAFLAENKEINIENANFFSLNCSSYYNNNFKSKISQYNFICKHCSRKYLTINKNSKYCSTLCKQKNYRIKKKSGNLFDKKLEILIKKYPCEICNWNEAPRDCHHIIPVSNNGKTIID